MAGPALRYAELTCTPYTSVLPHRGRHPDRGLHRGDRGRAGRGRAGLRAGAALDLRHPRRERAAGGRRHARLRARPRARRAGRLRARRAGDRRTRGRSSSRTSTRPAPPACTACRTPARPPGPETVWDALRLLGAERIGHGTTAAAGPGAARPPGRRRHPAGGVPDVQRRHPRGRVARRAPAARVRRGRRDGHHQLRRPADVRHHASTRSTPSPPSCSTSTRRGVAELARAAVRGVVRARRREGGAAGRDRRRTPADPRTSQAPQTHTLRGRLICIPLGRAAPGICLVCRPWVPAWRSFQSWPPCGRDRQRLRDRRRRRRRAARAASRTGSRSSSSRPTCQVASDVDVVLYDTFGQVQGDGYRPRGPAAAAAAPRSSIFSWNLQPELVDARARPRRARLPLQGAQRRGDRRGASRRSTPARSCAEPRPRRRARSSTAATGPARDLRAHRSARRRCWP